MNSIRTLKGKMILGFFAIILMIFVVLIYTCYEVLAPQLMASQLDMQTRYAEILCDAILSWKQGCERISAQTAVEDELQAYLRMDPQRRQAAAPEVSALLQKVLGSNGFIRHVFLVDKGYHIVGTGDVDDIRPYVLDRVGSAERAAGGAAWDSGYDTNSMMLYRAINDARYAPNESIGYLFLQIDNEEIIRLFNRYRLHTDQRFSLKGQFDGFEVTEQGFFYSYYENYAKLIHVEITMSPWFLRTWNKKEVALETSNAMIRTIAMVIFVSCLCALGFCILIAQQVTKPIMRMKVALKHYGAGDFSDKVEIRGKGELAELGHIVNDMSEQISALFDRVKVEENQRRKLELQTLVYQINPHFLYNALDAVNAIARQHKDEQVAEIVTALSRLFRLGLHQGQEFVTIRDEAMHVRYYLEIQQIRFAEQLRWEMDIDPELLERKICKFILQPVVENAIYYGVKSREDGGRVWVTGRASPHGVVFTVEDTGEGMRPAELAQVRLRIHAKTIPEGQPRGFGLWNVNQRIKMYYGPGSGVEVYSTFGEGTRVVLCLRLEDAG